MLDDYAVHLMPELRKALWDPEYILLIIGGNITEFIQVNDTHLQKQLHNEYREKEVSIDGRKAYKRSAKDSIYLLIDVK